TLQAVGLMSIPIHLRFSFSAAINVVPQPQNPSRIKSPGLLLTLIILSNRASGFCVGYPTLSDSYFSRVGSCPISSQRLSTTGPLLGSKYFLYRGYFKSLSSRISPVLLNSFNLSAETVLSGTHINLPCASSLSYLFNAPSAYFLLSALKVNF